MKLNLHPQYFAEAKIRCACGSEFVVGATKERLEIEVCSQCHPFYTGQEKVVDSAGRIERYRQLVKKATAKGKRK